MTIYEIAKEAGVSPATVSRVINGKVTVKEDTKKKIIKVLEKYSYTPNAFARGLVFKSMNTVAIIMVDIRDAHYVHTAYKIEQEFSKLGYNSILCNMGYENTEKAKYFAAMSERQVDGVILIGSVFQDAYIEKQITKYLKQKTVVIVNGVMELDNVFSILCDDKAGVEKCVDLLFAKGHRKIIFVQDSKACSASSKREGYLSSMNKNSMSPGHDWIVSVENTFQGGNEAVHKILDMHKDVSAIVFGEDIMAIGAMNELLRMGYSIPKDIAVTGYNNSIYGKICGKVLTSVDNKLGLLGTLAARVLYDRLNGSEVARKIVISPDIIRGETI